MKSTFIKKLRYKYTLLSGMKKPHCLNESYVHLHDIVLIFMRVRDRQRESQAGRELDRTMLCTV